MKFTSNSTTVDTQWKAHQSPDLQCYPFEIQESKDFGRFFVATRDISPLELVLIDQPAVVGPATKTQPICLECLKGPLSLSTTSECEGCHFPICQQCHDQSSNRSKRFHSDRECNIIAKCSQKKVKMGFSNLRDSGICAMNNFEFWRQISVLLFVVCFWQQIISRRFAAKIQNCSWHRYHYRIS